MALTVLWPSSERDDVNVSSATVNTKSHERVVCCRYFAVSRASHAIFTHPPHLGLLGGLEQHSSVYIHILSSVYALRQGLRSPFFFAMITFKLTENLSGCCVGLVTSIGSVTYYRNQELVGRRDVSGLLYGVLTESTQVFATAPDSSMLLCCPHWKDC